MLCYSNKTDYKITY